MNTSMWARLRLIRLIPETHPSGQQSCSILFLQNCPCLRTLLLFKLLHSLGRMHDRHKLKA